MRLLRPTVGGGVKQVAFVALLVHATCAHSADWPTHRHDNYRSGKTPEQLDVKKLAPAWTWRSPAPPQPAWPPHAQWDAFANLKGLKSMRNYDPVFHPVIVGQSLFFGSSVDDSVYCLDTRSGKVKWIFTTDAPVRIAPAHADGKLYFGSDDGCAYCVEAGTGKLVWKFRPVPLGRMILHNGRFISLHPVRTGVLVDNGTAYFAAGMLPWHSTYLCALSAETGKPEGPGRYVQKLEQATIEGPLLCTTTHLVAPQGRIPPALFERATGKKAAGLGSGGGCFVLITADDQVLHGPGNKTGWITGSNVKTGAKLATYKDATAMVVHGNMAYLQTDKGLSALDRKTNQTLWNLYVPNSSDLILSGDTLYVGGTDTVAAFTADKGDPLTKLSVHGRAHGLAAADGALFVSTDEGEITCFRPGAQLAEQPPLPNLKKVFDRLLTPTDLAIGPFLRFTGPESALLEYETTEPCPTSVNLVFDKCVVKEYRTEKVTTKHALTLTGLRRNAEYQYTIQFVESDKEKQTKLFDCETSCNFVLTSIDKAKNPFPEDKWSAANVASASEIADNKWGTQGVCLVMGMANGRLAWELACRTNLRVIGVDTDAARVAAARRLLLKAGCYGSRITVLHVESYDMLPFVGGFANLIVMDHSLEKSFVPSHLSAETSRLVHPYTTIGLLSKGKNPKDGKAVWRVVEGTVPKGAGVWSHLYGLPDNSAFGGESLAGAKSVNDLEEQWLGEPGPRFNPDRNGRKPAPLAIGGKLFVQGMGRLLAQDAYNGAILWSMEVPNFARFNMPRDCGNWCADDKDLFIAVKGHCWRIDAASGQVKDFWPVLNGPNKDWKYDWGYIARSGNLLVGSAVRAGTSHTNFWGGAGSGWYDAKSGDVTHQICSDNLFALGPVGLKRWLYSKGVILNSTITIGDGHIFFVECRHPKVLAAPTRKLGLPELWQEQFLVALDLGTGMTLWEKPLSVTPGTVVFYLAHSDDKLVLVSSNKQYHVYGFSAKDGAPLWQANFPWQNGDHGGHMSHPAIVKGKVYVRPRLLDLHTGKLLPEIMPKGGCGSYACSTNTVIFRAGDITLWDPLKNKSSHWPRLRPDCWLSAIPACGLLLAPEGGGGCSCGSWLETSIAFRPKASLSKAD